MSLQFSNTTTKNGILQRIERTCGFNDGDITSSSTRLAQFTGDVNEALDSALRIIFETGGTWQFDDINHTDYPIITTDINSGQRDYPFTTDGSSNLILEIHKVFAKDSSGIFHEIFPVDSQSSSNTTSLTDGRNTGGQPWRYDKTANAIFLDPVPNYTSSGGLKMYISREGSYFTTADTTKKPGIAGLFHEYLVLRPAYFYCLRNRIPVKNDLKAEMEDMEKKMRDFYKKREKDARKRLTGKVNKSE